MKTGKERKGKRVEPSTNCNGSTGSIGVNISTKRNSAQGRKATGKNEHFLVQEDELPSITGQALSQQLPDKRTCPPETTKESPVLKLVLGLTLDPSLKIKLQLFPIDEGTRIGLERDGHHPYLELTLRARKKISSVLKHINSKWGSSSIALGEPILCPYHMALENMSSYRTWSLSDDDISAGDVYAATGSPSVFRLKYGWFSSDPKTFATPSTSIASEPCSKSEGVQKGCSSNMEDLYGKGKPIELTRNKFKTNNMSEGANVAAVEKMSMDVSVKPVIDEVRVDNGLSQTSDLWADSLTNISIGGLLSEASLQAKLNNCSQKSDGSKSSFRIPSTFTPFESCSQSGGIQTGCSSNVEKTYGKRKQIEVTGEDYKPTNINEVTNAVVAEKMRLDLSVEPQDNEIRMDNGLARPSALWDDCLTNISIGGLLSEVSLQGKFNNCSPKTNKSNSGLQPSLLISDSFDAFIAGQMQLPQGPRLPSHEVHSSILDAEETCHAFPCQKFSSSGKDFLVLGGANSGACSQDAGSKSFKLPKFAEVSSQTGLPQDHTCQESKTDPLLCSGGIFADDSSLGLAGIKWNDSLGPFDLGLSSSRKIINGDSISLSGFVR
ncbi:hypothetical protein PVL29_027081 [Vitis rotundifolia]|uniref:TSL-kinase interacting protein 1 n=1 Tax=Vitis rotundifolia TaxID=103349 RepID=A0AA38YI74_VITRO|nr:hypothetical protein PVL29_027081 [Vitis rotundifolia]